MADVSHPILSESERRVLEFASAHSVVLADQVARLLGAPADEAAEVLAGLTAAGLVAHDRVGGEEPSWFRITGVGLRLLGSRASPPGFDPRWRHAVGAGWLWLVAREGELGGVDRVLSERQMCFEDRNGGADAPFALRPDLFGGGPGVHYPDLVLLVGSTRRAVELLSAAPARRRLEGVLQAYAADARVQAVMFLVADLRLNALIRSVAAGLELSPMVRVQLATLGFG